MTTTTLLNFTAEVIIATYNNADITRVTLNGYAKQSYKSFSIAIADDGSDDSIRSLVDEFNDKLNIRHMWQKDKGYRRALILNKCIATSAADYIILVDNDCIPHKHFIKDHIDHARKKQCITGRRANLGPAISQQLIDSLCSIQVFDNPLTLLKLMLEKKLKSGERAFYLPLTLSKLLSRKKRGLLGSNMAAWRQDLVDINGFDGSFTGYGSEETDLEWRLEANNVRIKSLVNHAIQFHLYHEKRIYTKSNKQLIDKKKRENIIISPYGIREAKQELPSHIIGETSLKHILKLPTAIISFGTLLGGMEMDALKLAKSLQINIDVTLITRTQTQLDKYARETCEKLGISIESVSFRTFFSPSLIFGVRKTLKRNRIKNVIFFGASEMRSLYFSFIGLDINLIIRHGTMKTTSKKDILHKLIYSSVNWHVSICKNLSSNVKKIIPFGKKSQEKLIYSVLRYIPTDMPKPVLRKNTPLKILHVARIAPGKGHIDAIKACKALHSQNIPFELHLAGEIHPPFQRQFESALDACVYKGSIILHGFCNNVPDLLKQSDIFLFPSSGEGLSNSFIEALAYGLVCICYNNTSFPELKDLGFIMHLADNANVNDLSSKLMDAIGYMDKNPVPIERNMQLAKKLFSSQERELKEYLDILV